MDLPVLLRDICMLRLGRGLAVSSSVSAGWDRLLGRRY